MPLLPLDAVVSTAALKERTSRAANLTAHNEAFYALSQRLISPPLDLLQQLLESALKLCNAGTAGISLLDDSGPETVFRWVALAGRYRDYVGGTTPRFASPCGYTLDCGSPQLFAEPGRHFACFEKADPPIIEGLVLPIRGTGAADVGTIWVVSHTRKVEFDMEDVRVMTSLAGFAAFACSQLTASAYAA
jgi:GAF domain-containing protein